MVIMLSNAIRISLYFSFFVCVDESIRSEHFSLLIALSRYIRPSLPRSLDCPSLALILELLRPSRLKALIARAENMSETFASLPLPLSTMSPTVVRMLGMYSVFHGLLYGTSAGVRRGTRVF